MYSQITKGGTESFLSYLRTHKDQVKNESLDGYYHVNVVAEAYNQGFKDGKESGKKDFVEEMKSGLLEKYMQKANQVYLLAKKLVSFMNEYHYSADSLHISVAQNSLKTIVAVNSDLLTNDEFVELSYNKIFELKRIFCDLFNDDLDIGLVSSDHLDKELLEEDGFGYSEDLRANE